jgi:ATP-dependent RNA helicase DOB1
MAKMDLNEEDEKKLVEGVFENAMDSLSNEDKRLPQVVTISMHSSFFFFFFNNNK